MVLPWLIIGAGAAIEARRRANGGDPDEEVTTLRHSEAVLKRENAELCKSLKTAVRDYEAVCSNHAKDLESLEEYKRLRADIEGKIETLNARVEQLTESNARLLVENASLEDKAALFQLQNEMLEDNAKILREENQSLVAQLEAMGDADREERVKAVMAELQESVSAALRQFTDGKSSPSQLQDDLAKLGIQVECSPKELAAIQGSQPAGIEMKEEISQQMDSQVGFILEDRARMERLMGIAQQLHLPSALAATPSNASSASTMTSRTASTAAASDAAFRAPQQGGGSTVLQSGLFRSLGFGSTNGSREGMLGARGALAAASDELQHRLSTLSVEDTTPSAAAPLPKRKAAKKPGLTFKFKGLADKDTPHVQYDAQRPSLDFGADDDLVAGPSSSALSVVGR